MHGGPKFSPDGRFVYLASRDGWISLYDLHNLKLIAEIRVGLNTRNLAVSKDGRWVLVGNYLPGNLVVLDARGLVQQANPVAVTMLGEPLTGQRWLDVITRSFRPRSDDGMEVSLKDGRRVKLEISALLSKTAYTQPGQLIMLTDLTQTRQLQNRLSHLQRLSALGKMMASLAHQIRTPLSSAMQKR